MVDMAYAYEDSNYAWKTGGRRRNLSLITERNQSQVALRESEVLLRSLAENSSAAIYIYRGDRCIYVNPVAEAMTGYTRDELMGMKFWDLIHPEMRDAVRAQSEAHPKRRGLELVPNRCEIRVLTKSGQERWSEVTASRVMFLGQPSALVTCFDITEHKRAEEALRMSEESLRLLTGRLLNLQDEERRRIARELHDVTAQNLFAITINLARLQQGFLRPSDAGEVLAECQALGEQSLREIRTLSYLLHPPMLDQAGLVSALQWYIEGFIKRSGIDVNLATIGEVGRLPSEVETTLFRIVQEGLTNIHRHSGSGTASIRLQINGDRVFLQIEDQGCGLPAEAALTDLAESVLDGAKSLGVGIAGMRERLRQLGGRLEYKSNEQGTVVTAVVPLTCGGIHLAHDALKQ